MSTAADSWIQIVKNTAIAHLPEDVARAIAEGIGKAVGLPNTIPKEAPSPRGIAKAAIGAAARVDTLSDKTEAAYDAVDALLPKRDPQGQ